jgi:hypothetical protein
MRRHRVRTRRFDVVKQPARVPVRAAHPGDPQLSQPIISRTLPQENRIMSADRTSPAVRDTTSGYRSRSAVAGRAAGWIAAVILLSAFAAQAYWAAGGSRAAGSDFDPLLPPLLAAALAVTLTLGAATLLLTRIGAIPLRMPRWLLRWAPGRSA